MIRSKILKLIYILIFSLFVYPKCLANTITVKTELTSYGRASIHLFCDDQGYQDHIWGNDDLEYDKNTKQLLQKLDGYSLRKNNLFYYFIIQAAQLIRSIENKLEITYDQVRFGKLDCQVADVQSEHIYHQKCFYENEILQYLKVSMS